MDEHITENDMPSKGHPLDAASVGLLRGDIVRGPNGQIETVKTANPDFVVMVSGNGYLPSLVTFLGRPDADGWIPHDGGDNPAPGMRVDVRYQWPGVNGVGDGGPHDVGSYAVDWSQPCRWRPHVAPIATPAAPAAKDAVCAECGGKGYVDHEGGEGEGHPSRVETEACSRCAAKDAVEASGEGRAIAENDGDAVRALRNLMAPFGAYIQKHAPALYADMQAALIRPTTPARAEALDEGAAGEIGAAIQRVEAVSLGGGVLDVYGAESFAHPTHTFRGDLRALLARTHPSPTPAETSAGQGRAVRCFECESELWGPVCLECNLHIKAAVAGQDDRVRIAVEALEPFAALWGQIGDDDRARRAWRVNVTTTTDAVRKAVKALATLKSTPAQEGGE